MDGDIDDDPDMQGSSNNNSLLINGFQQRAMGAARHKGRVNCDLH
jgi:hypothetical protein